MPLMYEYDQAKNAANIALRGLSFDLMEYFDWTSATMEVDRRKDYGEPRFQARGLIARRLHVVVFTWRGAALRIISLRKANRREEKRYAQQTQSRMD